MFDRREWLDPGETANWPHFHQMYHLKSVRARLDSLQGGPKNETVADGRMRQKAIFATFSIALSKFICWYALYVMPYLILFITVLNADFFAHPVLIYEKSVLMLVVNNC